MSRDPLPNLERLSVINEDGSRNHVHPADVSGRFNKIKPIVYTVLIAVYALLPWTSMNGHPTVLIDIPGRHFYIFGNVYNAQDAPLLVFILTGIGFILITATALFGRVWCGWACPQTVFLEHVFRRIERWIDGPRNERMALAKKPWSTTKIFKRILKQSIFFGVSFVIAHVFLSYFVPLADVVEIVRKDPSENWTAFLWASVVTGIVYFNFMWFREQLCLIICPYGRLQSALIDKDSIIIGYDEKRGEPRGKPNADGVGDCVDCRRCVVVCPTGIDIRNGLQMECIGCANCIDACDAVMVKLNRPTGLVRYDSRRGLEGGKTRVLRPRLYFYALAGLVGMSVATFMFLGRGTFESNVVHTGMPYVVDNGTIQNQRMVHIVKKSDDTSTFTLRVADEHDARIEVVLPQHTMDIPRLGTAHLPVILKVNTAAFSPPMKATLIVEEAGRDAKTLTIEVLGPRRKKQ